MDELHDDKPHVLLHEPTVAAVKAEGLSIWFFCAIRFPQGTGNAWPA